ncbi:MAG TPA: type II secretion system protein [Candidatus Paceibacterota bacterium]|nr:type II secretion system protein [Candidatus Paceibacterota bacterium]
MRAQRAFTLIELLIAIFIIGLLAAIVLSSLSGAKSRGNDTGVRAEIGTIATQAVLYYGLANTYGTSDNTNCAANADGTGMVFNDPNTTVDTPIVNSVVTLQKDASGGSANVVCKAADQRYLVMAKLSNGKWYCADYTATTTILGPVEVSVKPSAYTCQ